MELEYTSSWLQIKNNGWNKILGIYLDKYLNGHYQSKLVMQKLARALGMLSKVRHYVAKTELMPYLNPTCDMDVKFGINQILNLSKIKSQSYKRKHQETFLLQIFVSHLHLYSKNGKSLKSMIFSKWKIVFLCIIPKWKAT